MDSSRFANAYCTRRKGVVSKACENIYATRAISKFRQFYRKNQENLLIELRDNSCFDFVRVLFFVVFIDYFLLMCKQV